MNGSSLYPVLFYPDASGFSLTVTGFYSSDSYGYHFRSKPAPQWLRIPLALAMLVQYAGKRDNHASPGAERCAR